MMTGKCAGSVLAGMILMWGSSVMAETGDHPVTNGVTDPRSYYGRKAEGWFFYGDPGSREEASSLGETENEPTDINPEKIPLTAAWLRKNLPRYLDLAIDNPTSENVLAYFYLQRMALDRASAFARTAGEVIPGRTFLDENIRRPTSTLGAGLLDQASISGRHNLLHMLKDRISLVYLFDSSASGTSLFSALVKNLQDTYGFYVRSADCAENPAGDPYYPDAVAAPSAVEAFKVGALPALLAYAGEREYTPVSQGVVSLSMLESGILSAATRLQVLSPEEKARSYPYYQIAREINLEGVKLWGDARLLQPGDVVRLMEESNESERR